MSKQVLCCRIMYFTQLSITRKVKEQNVVYQSIIKKLKVAKWKVFFSINLYKNNVILTKIISNNNLKHELISRTYKLINIWIYTHVISFETQEQASKRAYHWVYLEIYVTMSTTLGISKVFILDKYFNELQKFWDTEKRLQGKILFH